jgi:hypothetical protein
MYEIKLNSFSLYFQSKNTATYLISTATYTTNSSKQVFQTTKQNNFKTSTKSERKKKLDSLTSCQFNQNSVEFQSCVNKDGQKISWGYIQISG